MGRPRPPPRAAPPAPASAGAHTHLQHELTLVSPHEDELSREPVAGAAAAHQEPRGDAHLGAHEARLALGVGGVIREGAPPPPRPRPLGTLKARSEPALLGLKHLHGATTAAAFRKAGLQASPSRTMPVLHRPPPRLRSPLMLWAHVYPLLCLGARAQEGGGAVVPEVLGADVVGGLGGGTPACCPETCHHQHKFTDTLIPHTHAHSFQTHSEHRPQAPEPRSWSGRAHTQAPSRALGAAHCPRIVGLPSSRSAGAKEGSSLCKGPSDTEKQGHWQRWWGGSIQGRGWGSGHASPWGCAPGRGTGQGPDAGSCVPGSPVAGPGVEQTPWRAQGLLSPWVLSPG